MGSHQDIFGAVLVLVLSTLTRTRYQSQAEQINWCCIASLISWCYESWFLSVALSDGLS